jgi:hypothetical protein
MLTFSSFVITWLDEFLGVPFLFLTIGRERLAKRQEEDNSKC